MLTVRVRTVCAKAEQKNTKQNNQTWLAIRENFLEEGKLVVCGASVACVVSHRYPIFMIFGIIQEYCRRLLVLPDTFMYTIFSDISLIDIDNNVGKNSWGRYRL